MEIPDTTTATSVLNPAIVRTAVGSLEPGPPNISIVVVDWTEKKLEFGGRSHGGHSERVSQLNRFIFNLISIIVIYLIALLFRFFFYFTSCCTMGSLS